jgi:glycosyltransferase involved in cell wall biosynthesis
VRVLIVINSLVGGGTERSVAETLTPLSDRGIEASVVCLESRPGLEDEVRRVGVPVEVLATGSPTAVIRGLRRSIRSIDPDVVHTALFESDILGRLATVGGRAAVLGSLVNTSYEPERLHDPNVRRSRLEAARMLDGWTGRHLADHFHAVSQASKDSAVRRLGLDPAVITVVERGRDPARLGEPGRERRLRARVALGIDEDCGLLVTVGRQEYQKDQLCLIEAMGLLAGRENLIALVAGRTGNATDALARARSASPVADRIRMLGQRDDVPEVLAAADVFVCTSRYEGLPGAVIEAMALGLPIVASAIAPIHEVVDPGLNAELFPPGDAQALAAALAKLLDDPARLGRMGDRSRKIFEDRFTLRRSLDRMVGLYEDVAGRGRRRRGLRGLRVRASGDRDADGRV